MWMHSSYFSPIPGTDIRNFRDFHPEGLVYPKPTFISEYRNERNSDSHMLSETYRVRCYVLQWAIGAGSNHAQTVERQWDDCQLAAPPLSAKALEFNPTVG
ncbi:hypothetical protein LMG26411_04414 [Cupriavidus numazuensis]|uniref:Uncharacterized protein n=1 Tax=Cupriavidus numazuensis TaxID=221992 RepID=A0ABM8TLH5_9BURK|nr:hypothetical protein LMG26411_04414 [Cupriavidus numazuensis]